MSDTTDPRLGTNPAVQPDGQYKCRVDAVEMAIRANASRVEGADKIVRDADLIYNYLMSGKVPDATQKSKGSSFKATGV